MKEGVRTAPTQSIPFRSGSVTSVLSVVERLTLARIIHHNRIADGHTVADWFGRTEVWRARSTVMGTLGGFASPFGPPPAASSPLASPFGDFGTCTFPTTPARDARALALGLAKPSRDAALPARARAKRAGWAGRRAVPKSPQGAEPAGSARGCLAREDIDLVRLVNDAG